MKTGRPAIRVNQLGYLPGAPQQATWVTPRPDPTPFQVYGADGTVTGHGLSRPWPERPERTSGQSLHVLDLPGLSPGDGYRIVAGSDQSHPFRVAGGLYAGLSRDALDLFRLLRSRHAGDVAVAACDFLYPDWDRPAGTFDVSGGWYDAGDYGKYVVSGSIALWQLLHLARFSQNDADLRRAVIAECRWQLDWMLRMQVPAGQPLAGMAFHRIHGTEWSPIPGRAEDDPTTRVLHRPSTAATLHLAAVAAFGARLLRDDDPAYAARLLTAARVAHDAAHARPDLIAPNDEGRFGGGPYGDPDVTDDFLWAAVNLWLATGDDSYRPSPGACDPDAFDAGGFDFDSVTGPALIDLATAGPPPSPAGSSSAPAVISSARGAVVEAAGRFCDLRDAQPYGQPYAPRDWAWGSNGRILNNLVVIATAHELTGEARFRDAVAGGLDYLLGRNALGQSYITAYGVDVTANLRTRQFGRAVPPGAVAGGANSTHTPGFPSDPSIAGLPPQQCYVDVATSETTNDICIRWNAPLAYVAAYVTSLA